MLRLWAFKDGRMRQAMRRSVVGAAHERDVGRQLARVARTLQSSCTCYPTTIVPFSAVSFVRPAMSQPSLPRGNRRTNILRPSGQMRRNWNRLNLLIRLGWVLGILVEVGLTKLYSLRLVRADMASSSPLPRRRPPHSR